MIVRIDIGMPSRKVDTWYLKRNFSLKLISGRQISPSLYKQFGKYRETRGFVDFIFVDRMSKRLMMKS